MESPAFLLQEEIQIAREYAEGLAMRLQRMQDIDPDEVELAWQKIDAGYEALSRIVKE